jgi:hypothetical protein
VLEGEGIVTITRIRIRMRKALNWIIYSGERGALLSGWITRDRCLMDQWDAAYRDGNILEMERLRALINKNWECYKTHRDS